MAFTFQDMQALSAANERLQKLIEFKGFRAMAEARERFLVDRAVMMTLHAKQARFVTVSHIEKEELELSILYAEATKRLHAMGIVAEEGGKIR